MAISQTIWLNCVVAVKTMMTITKVHRSTPNIPEHHFSYSHLPNKREEKENFDRF